MSPEQANAPIPSSCRAVDPDLDCRVRSIGKSRWIVEVDRALLAGATHKSRREWVEVSRHPSYEDAAGFLVAIQDGTATP